MEVIRRMTNFDPIEGRFWTTTPYAAILFSEHNYGNYGAKLLTPSMINILKRSNNTG